MAGLFTILYRSTAAFGPPALIVEDGRGVIYLFSAGALQAQALGREACARMVGLLGGRRCWDPVPRVAPYSLDGLRRLVAGDAVAAGAVAGAPLPDTAGLGATPTANPRAAGSRRA